jgi:GAF domain-containing protein
LEPLPETDEALDEYLEEEDLDLRALLMSMSREARRLVPSCVGLSLGLVQDGLTFTVVATAAEIAAIDAALYLEGGPCVEVAAGADLLDLDVADLLDEQRWSIFAYASAAQGIQSTLSLQILREDQVIGGINLYAARSGAFHGRHQTLARALGAAAESAVADADLGFETRSLARKAPRTLADVRRPSSTRACGSGSRRASWPRRDRGWHRRRSGSDVGHSWPSRSTSPVPRPTRWSPCAAPGSC